MESTATKIQKGTPRKEHGSRKPLKVRRLRGFKELVPDPYNLG